MFDLTEINYAIKNPTNKDKLIKVCEYLLLNYKNITISNIQNSKYTKWFRIFDCLKTFIDMNGFIPNRSFCRCNSNIPYFSDWIALQYKSEDILIKEIWQQYINKNFTIFRNFKSTIAYKKAFDIMYDGPKYKKTISYHRHPRISIDTKILELENIMNKYPNVTVLDHYRLTRKIQTLNYNYKHNKAIMCVEGSKEKWEKFTESKQYIIYKNKIKNNNYNFVSISNDKDNLILLGSKRQLNNGFDELTFYNKKICKKKIIDKKIYKKINNVDELNNNKIILNNDEGELNNSIINDTNTNNDESEINNSIMDDTNSNNDESELNNSITDKTNLNNYTDKNEFNNTYLDELNNSYLCEFDDDCLDENEFNDAYFDDFDLNDDKFNFSNENTYFNNTIKNELCSIILNN